MMKTPIAGGPFGVLESHTVLNQVEEAVRKVHYRSAMVRLLCMPDSSFGEIGLPLGMAGGAPCCGRGDNRDQKRSGGNDDGCGGFPCD